MCPNDADRMANSVDPDQTALLGAVWSGSALFAQTCLSENFVMESHFWKFQWSVTKNQETTCFQSGIVHQVWERHFKTSWNIMTSFNLAPFYLYNEEHEGTVQRWNPNIWVEILFLYARTSWRHLTLLPSIYIMKNMTGQYNVETQIYE